MDTKTGKPTFSPGMLFLLLAAGLCPALAGCGGKAETDSPRMARPVKSSSPISSGHTTAGTISGTKTCTQSHSGSLI